MLTAATAGLDFDLGAGGFGDKLLPTVVAAKIERLSIAFGVKSSCLVDTHSTDGIFRRGF